MADLYEQLLDSIDTLTPEQLVADKDLSVRIVVRHLTYQLVQSQVIHGFQ